MTYTNSIGNNWHIKSRYLFLIFILSFIISIGIWSILFSDSFSDDMAPLSDVLFGYVWYGILFYLIYLFSKKASVDWRVLAGNFSIEFFTSKYILIVLPLMAISIAGVFLFYYPLSIWFPDLVKYLLIDNEIKLIWLEGENYKLANLLSFFNVVIIVPIIEEIFFRGFLLTSMANKWGIKKAIVISSIFFGIGHADLIGATLFGFVLSVIYLKTNSLFAPIIIHIANNTTAFIVYYLYIYSDNTVYTISDFQGDWWIGLIALMIGLPWFIYFYRKEYSKQYLSIPYFQNVRV